MEVASVGGGDSGGGGGGDGGDGVEDAEGRASVDEPAPAVVT